MMMMMMMGGAILVKYCQFGVSPVNHSDSVSDDDDDTRGVNVIYTAAKHKHLPIHIRKTCPCNVYPLEPHFYIVKLGYAGVYLFFLFLLQNIDCGYLLEPPRRGGSNVYPQSMF